MTKRIRVRLPLSLKREVEEEAKRWGLSLAEVLRSSLMDFLEEYGLLKSEERERWLEKLKKECSYGGKEKTVDFTVKVGTSLLERIKEIPLPKEKVLILALCGTLKKFRTLSGTVLPEKVRKFLSSPLARALELYLSSEWRELHHHNEEHPECREVISRIEDAIQAKTFKARERLEEVFGEEGAKVIVGKFSKNPQAYGWSGPLPEHFGFDADPNEVSVGEITALEVISKFLKENPNYGG